jgi:hypothetical protein
MSKKIDRESFDRLVPDPNRFGCISYLAGHNPHWIQWSHSARETGPAKTWPGKIVAVEGEVLTVRKPDAFGATRPPGVLSSSRWSLFLGGSADNHCRTTDMFGSTLVRR